MKLIIDTKKDSREDILKAIKFLESISSIESSQTIQQENISQTGLAGFDMFGPVNPPSSQTAATHIQAEIVQQVPAQKLADDFPIENVMADIFSASASAEVKNNNSAQDKQENKAKVIEYY